MEAALSVSGLERSENWQPREPARSDLTGHEHRKHSECRFAARYRPDQLEMVWRRSSRALVRMMSSSRWTVAACTGASTQVPP